MEFIFKIYHATFSYLEVYILLFAVVFAICAQWFSVLTYFDLFSIYFYLLLFVFLETIQDHVKSPKNCLFWINIMQINGDRTGLGIQKPL